MEKNTTKTEVREKIQELFKNTESGAGKKAAASGGAAGISDVCPPVYRITEEGQPAGELSVCRIPNGMDTGRGRSGGWSAQLAAAVSGTVLFFHGGAGTFYGNCKNGRKQSVDERIM